MLRVFYRTFARSLLPEFQLELGGKQNSKSMGLPLPQLAFAGLGGLAFGYDLAVVAGAGPYIKSDLQLDDGTLEAVVALAKVGACCGVVLGAISMDLLGRQLSMTSVGFFFLTGPIFIAVSGNTAVLCFGRFLAGIAIGMSSKSAQLLFLVSSVLESFAPLVQRLVELVDLKRTKNYCTYDFK